MQNKENCSHRKCEYNKKDHCSNDLYFESCLNHNCSPFQVSLAGIQENISFQLYRLKGCRVRIHISCPGEDSYVDGKICNVGTDFVDISTDEKKGGERVVTIMISRICKIEWADKDCSPCRNKKYPDPCL